MTALGRSVALFALIVCASTFVQAVRFSLKPSVVKCFTEDLNKGTKCMLEYEMEAVPEIFSIIKLTGPDGGQIFFRENPVTGHYRFTTPTAGPYKVCVQTEKDDEGEFLLQGQHLDMEGNIIDTPREDDEEAKEKREEEKERFSLDDDEILVKINLLTGVKAEEPSKIPKEDSLRPIEDDIKSIEYILGDIISNLNEMKEHEANLRGQNESLNSKALWFSVLSSGIIMSVGIYQIIHLKKFLTHKKVI